MLLLLFLTFLSAVEPSWSGNRVGNGGDVLFCSKQAKGGEKTWLLDFYEVENNVLSSKEKDYKKIVTEVLIHLKKVAPKLSEQYERRLKTLLSELDFKKDIALVDVKDSLHAHLPSDPACKLKQIVIRQALPPENQKPFLVDETLWKKLSPVHKAGLILHEIIYEHFSKLGEWDSRAARRLNAHLFSEKFKSTTSGQFWLKIKELQIPLYPN